VCSVKTLTSVRLYLAAPLFALSCTAVYAAITSSGDVSPNPATILSEGWLTVGNTAYGQMTVDGGSALQTYAGTIAASAGSGADVTVTGAGSRWLTTEGIFFGYGPGTLNSSSAGVVDAAYQTIVIPGTGSSIQFNGGTLTRKTLRAENADLHGTGTINTEGWILEQDYTVNSINDLPSQIVLNQQSGQNIAVNINWAGGDGPFGVNTANVAIAGGTQVNARRGYIGDRPGSSGSISLSGAGTKLTFGDGNDELFIGYGGNGSLAVADGAVVTNDAAYLGYAPGTVGTASIHGAGAIWNTGDMYIGNDGQGILHISAGGKVNNEDQSYIGLDPGSSGTVTVDGPGQPGLTAIRSTSDSTTTAR
jgi:fibronectin-binding autotransporter adhesin